MTNTRNYGLDCLRIFAMCLITSIHFLCYTDIHITESMPFYNKAFIHILHTFNNCFIDIFVMVSGYFLCKKDFSINRITKLWLQVLTINLIVATFCLIFTSNSFNINKLIRSLFPITTASYWYIISYFLLILISPLYNRYLCILPKEKFKKIIMTTSCILFFIQLNPFFNSTIYIGDDTGIVWFSYMYILGAYIRIYDLPKHNIWIGIGIAAAILIFLFRWFNFIAPSSVKLLHNDSLPTMLVSIGLFLLVNKINIKGKKIKQIIGYMSSAALCVYLIQEQAFFRMLFWHFIDPHRFENTPYFIISWFFAQVSLWIFALIVYNIYLLLHKIFLLKIENSITEKIKLLIY
ncbi:acyltransferase [Phocaeicola vulgatus]|jgi:hypothetical protein|uniref:acyltransferase family protein n=1 Tax=Phocaeicola vulgatus TaxID=821 RepID=UPI001C387DFA|nr:acyltransferase family protein [Phocaeicola vulgatus]MBV4063085.1 acyltransferase [Phocaeicola vulgatus]MBV4112961.1 acyltransferase [Phocaeicola vulgatus]